MGKGREAKEEAEAGVKGLLSASVWGGSTSFCIGVPGVCVLGVGLLGPVRVAMAYVPTLPLLSQQVWDTHQKSDCCAQLQAADD